YLSKAEDGIRDFHVTGVQTCALPISPQEVLALFYGQGDSRSDVGANRDREFAQGRWFDFYAANRYRAQAEQACERHEPCAPCRSRRPDQQALPDAEPADESVCLVARARALDALWPEQTLARP